MLTFNFIRAKLLIILLIMTLTTILIPAMGCGGMAAEGRIENTINFRSRDVDRLTRSAEDIQAIEFPSGLDWLNIGRPLGIEELKGKVVLLDFWTFCCINCMHILPDLKKLERKYRNELVVIGVHSAKFTSERITENIRQAILRYEIEHPVVNDLNMEIWNQYAVNSWPTVYLIDPESFIVGYSSGEGVFEMFDRKIGELIEEFGKKGLIDHTRLDIQLERKNTKRTQLSFPGKVHADPDTGKVYISDSNHNRIVVATSEGVVEDIIGSGKKGFSDGVFKKAAFDHPQGLTLYGDLLYVADTENHSIRVVDFKKKRVETLVGTGEQAKFAGKGGIGRNVALNSPWDLVEHDDVLYIAMAGPHQLWKLDLKTGEAEPFAGNGREARIDGPLKHASLAQPSGITTDGERLYFADSEVSSIRAADIDPGGVVDTLVGLDLFVYGDKDGAGGEARLQHPLGVEYHDGLIYVADTYNNKIKTITPFTAISTTFLGTGEEGYQDGIEPLFDEPGGLSIANGRMYIADTNNHTIRVADLITREVYRFELQGI